MKHGDKTKGKASKASGKKSSKVSKGKAVQSVKAKSSASKSSASKASKKSSKPRQNGAGAARSRAPEDITFSNPAVGNAFKQAVKKYSNAFRKLTD